jgi:hypothetical protein
MKNTSSVIGYLGEVRAVTMLQELMNRPIDSLSGYNGIRGTGALRKDARPNEEIPIDVVCEEFGF